MLQSLLFEGINMRNIREYPVTDTEVIGAVEHALERYKEIGAIGGIDGFILHHIQDLLKNDKEVMAKLIMTLKI